MYSSLVMTVIGADRPGLVGRLSAAIADHAGNWLESRMAHLGGQFAGIVRVQVPAENEQALVAALKELASDGLSVQVQRDAAGAGAPVRTLATVEVVGHDRPGIVRQFSQVLLRHGVNVEELETHYENAPMSGEAMFHAVATVQLPSSVTTAVLRNALEEIASELTVDIAVLPGQPG